ncbi:mCG140072, partial [Mus musculus]
GFPPDGLEEKLDSLSCDPKTPCSLRGFKAVRLTLNKAVCC